MTTNSCSIAVLLVLALCAAGPRAHAQTCVGDCNASGSVGVEELITGVNIALGNDPIDACVAFDADADTRVSISELTRGVANATTGCRPAVQIAGGCAQPGPGPRGLVPCSEGTAVRAYRCDDRATCLSALSLALAGATQVQADGGWSMLVDRDDASADLILEADIEGIIAYRAFDFGMVGLRGRLIAGGTPGAVMISPDTEAAIRVLDLTGLEQFSDAGIMSVLDAVAVGTATIDYSVLAASGYSPVDAAALATLTAVRDPAVIDAVEQGTLPGVLPTRTATATVTSTPTGTQIPTGTPTPTATHTLVPVFAFVTNRDSDTVSVIDLNSNQAIDTIAVGESPEGIAITPDGRLAVVANAGPPESGPTDIETISIIDTAQREVVATVPDFTPMQYTRPFVVALSPDGSLAYVTHNAAGTVEVLDLQVALTNPAAARVGVIQVGAAPLGIAVARSRPFAYVANVEAKLLGVVDTTLRQMVREVTLADKPAFVALTSDDTLAFVSNQVAGLPGNPPGNTLSVIDTQLAIDNPAMAVVGTIHVGVQPTGLAVSADDRRVFAVNSSSDSLSIIERDREQPLVTTVPLLGGSFPQSIALSPDGRRAYVTNCAYDSVSVVDIDLALVDPLNAVVETLPVGICPQGIAIAGP